MTFSIIKITSRIFLTFYYYNFFNFWDRNRFCLVLDSEVQEISLRCNLLIAIDQFYVTECEVHKCLEDVISI